MSALDMRNHLVSLHAERAMALTASSLPEGLLKDQVAEIDTEIRHANAALAGIAVTEIATLRGELFGRQVG